MKTIIHFDNKTFYNPTRKTISKILHKSSVYFEMSLYLMKSRISPKILEILIYHKRYRTSYGGILILHKNMVYLTISSPINSLNDLNELENIFEKSKYEVLEHHPIYPENIKKVESFHKMLGAVWKKNS